MKDPLPHFFRADDDRNPRSIEAAFAAAKLAALGPLPEGGEPDWIGLRDVPVGMPPSRVIIQNELWVRLGEYARILNMEPPSAAVRLARHGKCVRRIEAPKHGPHDSWLYAWDDIVKSPELMKPKAR